MIHSITRMDFMLWSAAFVICLAVQVSSVLPPKPIGEWHPDRYEMYPNPWRNSSECRTPETSGLCDVNGMLNDTERQSIVEQPGMKASNADGCLCNKSCAQMRINVTVAIMKKIGPQITDYRAAAKEFAEKFRPFWNLTNCAVILIASNGDNMCFLDAGSDVNDLLPGVTENIDKEINDKYCINGSFADGINATLIKYRKALEAQTPPPTTALTQEMTSESGAPGGSPAIIVGVIVGVLVVIIGVIIIVTIFKRKAHREKAAEVEHLRNPPEDV